MVEHDEAQGYADEKGLLFMETSAKTAMNVNDIFLAIGKKYSVKSTIFSPDGREEECAWPTSRIAICGWVEHGPFQDLKPVYLSTCGTSGREGGHEIV